MQPTTIASFTLSSGIQVEYHRLSYYTPYWKCPYCRQMIKYFTQKLETKSSAYIITIEYCGNCGNVISKRYDDISPTPEDDYFDLELEEDTED